jgi:tetratricopeptide (TPR) repeat protein
LAATLRRTISPACRVRRWTRQHRWLVRSLAVSFLIVCLGIGYHLSTREPYAIRQLNTGMEHYRQGEYADAEEHLTLALESPEVRAEALFWRARSRQKAGHTLLAMEDYEEAAKLCSAPEIKACQAYCSASEGYFSASIQFSKASLDSGFATAEVYNNLGYSYLHASDFESAMLALNEAIARDHSLQAAFYNRALAELRWAARLGRPVALQAATDIENAIAAGPPSAALYLDAARVYSRLGTESGEHGERIIGCLCEALRLGQSPDIIQREFKSQLDDPALKALLTHYLPEGQPRKAIGLVDPLADDSFRLVAGPAQVSQPF